MVFSGPILALIAFLVLVIVGFSLWMNFRNSKAKEFTIMQQYGFLMPIDLLALRNEAPSRTTTLKQWSEIAIVRWVYSSMPAYPMRPFAFERDGIEGIATTEESADKEGSYQDGILYGLNKNDQVVVERHFYAPGQYNEVYRVGQRHSIEYMLFNGQDHSISYGRAVYKGEYLMFWEYLSPKGLYREEFKRFENDRIEHILVEEAEWDGGNIALPSLTRKQVPVRESDQSISSFEEFDPKGELLRTIPITKA